MTPEMMQAYLEIRHVVYQTLYVGYTCVILLAIILVLKVLIYRSVISQLHACWEILSVMKAVNVVADRRREDAQHSLEEIKRTVESIPCPPEGKPAQPETKP